MSNSLDPCQARRGVGPDLVPNCLQKLSADDTSRFRVKELIAYQTVNWIFQYLIYSIKKH